MCYTNAMKDDIYADEARERWGKTAAYKESQEKLKKMTPEQMDAIKKEGEEILQKGAKLVGKDVHDAEVQEFVAEHYRHLGNFYTPTPEIYRGLAEMYVSDERFRKNFEKYDPHMPEFLHDAMLVFMAGKK